MKKSFFILLAFICYIPFSNAQDNPVMVLNLKGDIIYHPPAPAKSIHLLPGMKINAEGVIKLENKDQIRLLNNGNTFFYNKEGQYNLGVEIANKKINNIGFGMKFWGFINEGLINADDDKTLDKYHQEFMSATGGVRGFADAKSAIRASRLTSENIGPSEVVFNWEGALPENSVYQFSIYHSDSEQMVYQALCRDPYVELDFKNIFFFPASAYYWQIVVHTYGTEKDSKLTPFLPEIKSEKISFQFVEHTQELILKKTSKVEGYSEADEITQQWMKAVVLEQEHFLYDAYIIYKKLFKNNPENLLIKKLFSAFLIRQNLLLESQKILNTTIPKAKF